MIGEARAREISTYALEHGDAAAAEHYGISFEVVARYRRQAKTGGLPKMAPDAATSCSDEINGESRTITTRSANITNLEELLAWSKVDLRIWEVDHYIVNSWEVTLGRAAAGHSKPQTYTNYQVKAWLRQKRGESREDVLAEFRADALRHAPRYPRAKRAAPRPGNLLEISVPDLHFGLLAWGKETGGGDYDLKIAAKVFTDAVMTLAQSAQPYGFERILLPIGNDFYNVNSQANTTVHGTPQDTDSRWQKSFTNGRRVVVEAIDRLRELAPVKVLVLSGNHDEERTYYLGESLSCWYHNCRDVEVDNGPTLRKYVRHGSCLIGFAHGDGLRVDELPLIMATEVQEDWAATVYREVHVGHFHHSHARSYQQETERRGVRVVVIPSLATPSAWSASKGYQAQREAQAFVWNNEHGRVATLHYHPQEVA